MVQISSIKSDNSFFNDSQNRIQQASKKEDGEILDTLESASTESKAGYSCLDILSYPFKKIAAFFVWIWNDLLCCGLCIKKVDDKKIKSELEAVYKTFDLRFPEDESKYDEAEKIFTAAYFKAMEQLSSAAYNEIREVLVEREAVEDIGNDDPEQIKKLINKNRSDLERKADHALKHPVNNFVLSYQFKDCIDRIEQRIQEAEESKPESSTFESI